MRIGFLLLVAMALFLPKTMMGDALPRRVVIVSSRSLPPYVEAAGAFVATLKTDGHEIHLSQFTLGENGLTAEDLLGQLQASPPDLLLTLGTHASRRVGGAASPIPTVFALVLQPGPSNLPPPDTQGGGHITGVCMDLKAGTYMEAIHRTFPSSTRVGILAGPNTEARLSEFEEAAEANGLQLISARASGEREVSRALSELTGKVDVLLAQPDPAVYTQGSTRYILLQTLRQGMPLIGPSQSFVESGAIMGVGLDYRQMGHQAGFMAGKILLGDSPGSLAVQRPDSVRLLLNARTSRLLGIRFSEDATQNGEVLIP